ncbi:hypothetical protein CEXT_180781 [Caerostris extrusa]|uniref:Uncharacterized protein n=1 Tax=Caerostris extrusa TaxID=172846 RepID=A0AAV4MF02_CAEEX|nr:hypothetical protein CEXT_180781 [Caerostris extrusa]
MPSRFGLLSHLYAYSRFDSGTASITHPSPKLNSNQGSESWKERKCFPLGPQKIVPTILTSNLLHTKTQRCVKSSYVKVACRLSRRRLSPRWAFLHKVSFTSSHLDDPYIHSASDQGVTWRDCPYKRSHQRSVKRRSIAIPDECSKLPTLKHLTRHVTHGRRNIKFAAECVGIDPQLKMKYIVKPKGLILVVVALFEIKVHPYFIGGVDRPSKKKRLERDMIRFEIERVHTELAGGWYLQTFLYHYDTLLRQNTGNERCS